MNPEDVFQEWKSQIAAALYEQAATIDSLACDWQKDSTARAYAAGASSASRTAAEAIKSVRVPRVFTDDMPFDWNAEDIFEVAS